MMMSFSSVLEKIKSIYKRDMDIKKYSVTFRNAKWQNKKADNLSDE